MPYFSIAVPIYNVEEYLPKCLDSILSQTFTDFEVICINDCSTDSTLQILEQYQAKDSRIKIFNQDEHKGVSVARNKAIDMASGQFLVWVDSDDWIEAKALEIIHDKLQQTGHNIIWHNMYRNQYDGKEFLIIDSNHPVLKEEGYYDITPENIPQFSDFVWNKVMNLSLLRELNIRFPEGLIFEDGEFYFKVYTQVKKIYYIKEPLYHYREREFSICTTTRKGLGHPTDLYDIFENIVDYAREYNIFQEYHFSILKFLSDRVYGLKLPNQKEIVLRRIDQILKKINFPEAFADLENNQPDASMIFIKK